MMKVVAVVFLSGIEAHMSGHVMLQLSGHASRVGSSDCGSCGSCLWSTGACHQTGESYCKAWATNTWCGGGIYAIANASPRIDNRTCAHSGTNDDHCSTDT